MYKELTCIMDIGERMLVCGAEISRVEESIQRMGKAFGAARVDAFIITSSMVVTLHDGEHHAYTQTRRVQTIGMDIEALHALNALSRRICADRLSVEAAEAAFQKVERGKSYPKWVRILSYGVISGAFALFFGGGWRDGAVSFGIGLLLAVAVLLCERAQLNKIFAKFFCTFFATVLAFAAMKAGAITTVDHTIIGFIMTLIPGVGLTNALRDLFVGDSIAGLLRTIEAVLFALAIAGGYLLAAFLMGGLAL